MVRKYEAWGVLAAFSTSILLHFLYTTTGIFAFTPFSAVNESLWEHLKIIYFGIFFYGIYEYFKGMKKFTNFLFGKAAGLLIAPLFVIIVYYIYTYFTGESILWIDISTALVSILLSHLISSTIVGVSRDLSRYKPLGVMLIIVMTFSFIIFTYFPPEAKIFNIF